MNKHLGDFLIAVSLLILLAMCMVGLAVSRANLVDEISTKWESWALENDFAHYDKKTGELILHTKSD